MKTFSGNRLKVLSQGFWNLFFPKACALCSKILVEGENQMCVECVSNLPLSYQWEQKLNSLTALFQGRLPLQAGSAFMFFERGGSSQKAIHQFKYHSKPQIAYLLGRIYGGYLAKSSQYREVDLVVAVPLHPWRWIKRGYNQSDYFSKGVARELGVEFSNRIVKRSRRTSQQALTRSSQARWHNVHNAFRVHQPERLLGRRVLLIDDVITTGATIESCAYALLKAAPSLNLRIGACAMVPR